MNTIMLQYAVEVEKTGSITQAAINLYMDQPNLSKAIKTLEESLGAPVFRRTSKGMVPTARGKIFLEHARNVLEQIEKMKHLYKPAQAGRVEFSLSMPGASYLSLAFSRFIRSLYQEEGMNVRLRETNTADTIKDVETGEYDLGIIRFHSTLEGHYVKETAAKGLLMEPVLEYTPRLLMSQEHPLAEKEEITGEDLMSYIEIVHGDEVSGRKKNCKKGEFLESPKRVYVFERGSRFNLLLEEPHTYMWGSPMPVNLLTRHGLVERRCRNMTGNFRDVLVYRKGYSFTAWDNAFFNELETVKAFFSE